MCRYHQVDCSTQLLSSKMLCTFSVELSTTTCDELTSISSRYHLMSAVVLGGVTLNTTRDRKGAQKTGKRPQRTGKTPQQTAREYRWLGNTTREHNGLGKHSKRPQAYQFFIKKFLYPLLRTHIVKLSIFVAIHFLVFYENTHNCR